MQIQIETKCGKFLSSTKLSVLNITLQQEIAILKVTAEGLLKGQ